MKTKDATTPSGKYAARIKNPAKRRYAWDYLQYLRYGGAEPSTANRGLSFMAMQAVRLQLHTLEADNMTKLRDYPNVQRAVHDLYACNGMPVHEHDDMLVPTHWVARFQLAETLGKLLDDDLLIVTDGEEQDREAWVAARGAPGQALDHVLAAAFEGEIWS